MSLLVIGACDPRSHKLASRSKVVHPAFTTGRSRLGICDLTNTTKTVAEYRPSNVVNAAAYMAFDAAGDKLEAAFARHIFEECGRASRQTSKVQDIKSAGFVTLALATRLSNSCLSAGKCSAVFSWKPCSWVDSIGWVVR